MTVQTISLLVGLFFAGAVVSYAESELTSVAPVDPVSASEPSEIPLLELGLKKS